MKNKYVKWYYDKVSLWAQLYGLVAFFGAFFVAMWEIPAYVGLPVISIVMFFSGAVIFVINKVIDDADFSEMYNREYNSIKEKVDRGELPANRLEMFTRLFK